MAKARRSSKKSAKRCKCWTTKAGVRMRGCYVGKRFKITGRCK